MTLSAGGLGEMGRRRLGFYVVTVAFAVVFTAIGSSEMQYLFTGWFLDLGIHHFHHILLGATLGTVGLGMYVQLFGPEANAAGVLQSLLVLLSVFTGWQLGGFFHWPMVLFLSLVGIAGLLHPLGRDVLRVRTPSGSGLLVVALVVLAAGPVSLYAADQIALQRGDSSSGTGAVDAEERAAHAEAGHYASMAGMAIAIVVLGLLAALRPPGWWVPAWSAGGLATVLGLASLLLPAQASSGGSLWGALAVLWGLVFVGSAELTGDGSASPLGRWGTSASGDEAAG